MENLGSDCNRDIPLDNNNNVQRQDRQKVISGFGSDDTDERRVRSEGYSSDDQVCNQKAEQVNAALKQSSEKLMVTTGSDTHGLLSLRFYQLVAMMFPERSQQPATIESKLKMAVLNENPRYT